MKLATRLTLLLILLSILPLGVVSYLEFLNAKAALQHSTINSVKAIAVLKRAEFSRWIEDSMAVLENFSQRPLVVEYASTLTTADPNSVAYKNAYEILLRDHLNPVQKTSASNFTILLILNAEDGKILISNDKEFEGQYRNNEGYFQEGLKGKFVDKAIYVPGEHEITMHMAMPIRNARGEVVAVLIGHLNFSEMSEIMLKQATQETSEETYLINKSNYFVTDSRLLPDSALKETIHTEGVNSCLAGLNDFALYENYLGDPVIGAYQWMPEYEMCIITEVHQAEAFASTVTLQKTALLIGSFAVVLLTIVGIFFARTISKPILQLVHGTELVAQGDLAHRINIKRNDELGKLAESFNQMTSGLDKKEEENKRLYEETRNWALELDERVKKRTDELQKSETRYRQLFEETVDGFALHEIICDENGQPVNYRFLEVNPAFEKLTGLKADALIGHTVLEVMPDTEPIWIERYGQVALTGEPVYIEDFAQELNKYFAVNAFCPEPGKFAVLFADITERKRPQILIEARIRLLEYAASHSIRELLQKTLDEVCTLNNSPIGFYHFVEADQETLSLQAWSTRTREEFCTAAGEGTHYPVSEAGAWADSVRLRKPIIHNDYASLSEKKGMPDGHAEVIRELVVPIMRDDRVVALLGVGNKAQDYTDDDVNFVTYFADIAWEITKRKLAEKQVEESEEKYRSLFEHVPDGVYRTTPDGEFLTVNPAFLHMFGFDSEEELERLSAFEFYIDKKDRHAFMAQLTETGQVHNMEARMRRKDGQEFYGLDNCRIVHDEQGNVMHYEGTLTDISERKIANQKVELHRQELERLYRASGSLILNSSDSLRGLAQTIVETVLREFEHSNCSLLLVKGNSDTLQRIAVSGDYTDQVFDRSLTLNGKGLVSLAIRSGEFVNAPDVLSRNDYIPNWEQARSELVIPLKVGEKVIGAIDIQSAELQAFSADDERLMTVFAERAAMALERVRLYETERRRASRLNSLQKMATDLAALHSEQELLNTLVVRSAVLGNSPTCTIMLLDEDANEAVLVAQTGFHDEGLQDLRVPLELPLIKQSLQTRDPIIIADIDRDAPAFRQILKHPDVQAFFAFPLIVSGKVLGYITLSKLFPHLPSDEEITSYKLLAKLASASLENVRLLEETQRNLGRLASLRIMDVAIASSFDLVVTLDVLLEQVVTQLQIDAANILLFNTDQRVLKYIRGIGFRTKALQHTTLRFGDGYAGRAALERRMIKVLDLKNKPHELNRSTLFPGEEFVAYFGVPLLAKGVVKGVLEVFSRKPIVPGQEWLDFLEVLAGQAAIAIDNSELYNDLQRSNTELFMAYDNTLEGWANALELRDQETEGHARRVADLTTQLAKEMGVQAEEMIYYRWGALLHDIGKMGIPDSILLKPGKLTDAEWIIMHTHPEIAFQWLSKIEYLRPAVDIPYCHHEKWDGSGYPRGLKREQIPLSARIFAVIDVWDALRSDRPYRNAWSQEKTLAFIREQSGSHLDPDVVDAFMRLIEDDDQQIGIN